MRRGQSLKGGLNAVCAEDIPELLKRKDMSEIMSNLIKREQKLCIKLTTSLVSSLHERDGDLMEQLYIRLLSERTSNEEPKSANLSPSQPFSMAGQPTCANTAVSGLHYNMMVASAAKFNKKELLEQLLFETTVLGVPLDLNTYAKCLVSLELRLSDVSAFIRTSLLPRDILSKEDVAFVEHLVSTKLSMHN